MSQRRTMSRSMGQEFVEGAGAGSLPAAEDTNGTGKDGGKDGGKDTSSGGEGSSTVPGALSTLALKSSRGAGDSESDSESSYSDSEDGNQAHGAQLFFVSSSFFFCFVFLLRCILFLVVLFGCFMC